MSASIATVQPSPSASPTLASLVTANGSGNGLSFHDLLNVVNPLQHIPVVSTLYRAITGDTITPLERIAGDTLYGGAWGFVSSVANVAFQEITGKDIGDTVLGWIEGDDDASAIAANPAANSTDAAQNDTAPDNEASPISASDAIASMAGIGSSATPASLTANGPPAALQSPMPQTPSTANDAAMQALMKAMSDKGIDSTLSQRALSAYRKSLSTPPATLVPTS